MKNCQDRHFSNMIYAYELNLLPELDRREFEMHLLDCEACFENLRNFRQEAHLLRYHPKVKESVRRYLDEKDLCIEEPGRSRTYDSKVLWKFLIPAAVTAVAIIFLILIDWEVEIKPFKEASAAENRLIISYFNNVFDTSDTARLADIATNLLITELSESKYLQVTSTERLLNIITNLGLDKNQSRQPDKLYELAREADAKWILSGKILKITPEIIVTSQLIEVATGDVVASQRIVGEIDEDIFDVIDKLSLEIKRDLSLPALDREKLTRSIADITTYSPEAYRHYLEGVEYKTRFYIDKAVEQFELALEHDSTLAMAYFYLAAMKDQDLIHKALKFSEHASRREKYHIKTSYALISGNTDKAIEILQKLIKDYRDDVYAYWRLGQAHLQRRESAKAIMYFEEAISIDPLYRNAHNSLAYAFDDIGDLEQSILAINRYIDIAPNEANPYDTRGDIFARHGKHGKAIESYEKALSIKPDHYISLEKLGHQYLFNNEFIRADSCYRILIVKGDENTRLHNQFMVAAAYLRKGAFTNALSYLDSLITIDNNNNDSASAAANIFHKARIHISMKNFDKAVEYSEESREMVSSHEQSLKLSYQTGFVSILAEAGKIEEARNELEDLKSSLEQYDMPMIDYWYAKGYLEFYDRKYNLAIDAFQELQKTTPDFISNYMLARAYLQNNQISQAADKFVYLLHFYQPERLKWPIENVMIHYYLGQTYEESHWNDKATEQYHIFLTVWKDADVDIKEISDAEKRISRLKQGS